MYGNELCDVLDNVNDDVNGDVRSDQLILCVNGVSTFIVHREIAIVGRHDTEQA